MRRYFEKTTLFNGCCSAAKLDVEKAFDTCSHHAIVDALISRGVPAPLVVGIMAEYEDAKVSLSLDGNELGEVEILRGVRQGSPLSALLFQLVMDNVMRDLWPSWVEKGFGVRVSWQPEECDYGVDGQHSEVLTNLCFADDTTLITEDPVDLQIMIEELANSLSKAGLKLSIPKTKWMTTWPISEHFYLEIEGEKLKKVELVGKQGMCKLRSSSSSQMEN